ncbi:MAG: hypothetical protein Unbinned6201contig1000_21 [Prokaryotic dsDNA virus sp.]|nr:MAG: hypothetical protein Unbinned6201contig1000_21 [Prokaryotic dsDNA virus sp.]
MAIGAIGGAIAGHQKADMEKRQAQAQLKQTALDRELLQKQTDQTVQGFKTQQEQVGRQGEQVLGAQTSQAGKVGLAGDAGSFAGMQSQVRKQVTADIGQLGQDIATTQEMADIKERQSLLGDAGLQKTAGQDPFLAGLAGALGGGLSGFTAAGGDLEGGLHALGGAVSGGLQDLGKGIGDWSRKGVYKYGQGEIGKSYRSSARTLARGDMGGGW